jgi:hypothetical protein
LIGSSQDELFEQVRRFLPPYLTSENKKDLFSELKKFPDKLNYFWDAPAELRLQGDAWRPFTALRFEDGQRKQVAGVIVSNSCDIDASNERHFRANVLYAPLISMDRFAKRLTDLGLTVERVSDVLGSIRRQENTRVFYLPASAQLPEALVQLDDIHAEPLDHFLASSGQRLFSLSQGGFYVFLIKLAIHFTRVQEGVSRTGTV